MSTRRNHRVRTRRNKEIHRLVSLTLAQLRAVGLQLPFGDIMFQRRGTGPKVLKYTISLSAKIRNSCGGMAPLCHSEAARKRLQKTLKSYKYTKTYLPQRPELLLINAQELAVFPSDNSSVSWGVVQNRLSERCARPQGAYGSSILPKKQMWSSVWMVRGNPQIIFNETIRIP